MGFGPLHVIVHGADLGLCYVTCCLLAGFVRLVLVIVYLFHFSLLDVAYFIYVLWFIRLIDSYVVCLFIVYMICPFSVRSCNLFDCHCCLPYCSHRVSGIRRWRRERHDRGQEHERLQHTPCWMMTIACFLSLYLPPSETLSWNTKLTNTPTQWQCLAMLASCFCFWNGRSPSTWKVPWLGTAL